MSVFEIRLRGERSEIGLHTRAGTYGLVRAGDDAAPDIEKLHRAARAIGNPAKAGRVCRTACGRQTACRNNRLLVTNPSNCYSS